MTGRAEFACISLIFLYHLSQTANAAVYTLDVRWGYGTPDCVERDPMVLINGVFPGPVLRVTVNETVQVTVKNHLDGLATSMHWHGVDQIGNPWADGAAGTSECALGPLQERTYTFTAPSQPGTHYYHGHVGLAKESGAYGMLLVDPPSSGAWPTSMAHDADIPLMIQDWYHGPALSYKTGLLQSSFRWAGDPQSILVNGQGHFNCTDNHLYGCDGEVCREAGETLCTATERPYYFVASHHQQCRPQDCPGWFQTNFTAGKRHLLRIVNAGTLSLLNVAIQNHTMMVVELDGEPVVPVSVASLDLHVGQRAGVVVVADQAPDVYWISIKVRGRPSVRFGAAVIRYTTAAVPPGSEPREQALLALRKSQPAWDDIAFTLAQQREFEHPDAANAPSSVAERISILSTQERFAPGETSHVPDPPLPNDPNLIGQGDQRPENYCDGSGGKLLKWASARVPHQETRTPVLLSLYYQTPSMQELGRSKGQFLLQLGQTYDIVLQNYPACNGVCETHPWHMHGHHFWVVGTWPGEFNGTLPTEGTGGKLYRRDTIMIIGEGEDHRPTTRRGCGFTVIRFVANNPGAWPFHCHAEWHQIMGMGVTLYYPSNTIPAPRSADHSICGDVTPEIAAARHQTDRGPQTNVKFAVELLWLANARYHPVILVVAGLPLAIIAFLVKRRWDFGAHRGAENSARGEHLDSDAAISRTERAISGTDEQSAEPKEQAVEADRFRV